MDSAYTTSLKFNPLNQELAENGVDMERYETLENCSYHTTESLSNKLLSMGFGNGLSLLHINARSLTKNIEAILDLLTSLDMKLTCLLITETWLTDTKAAPVIPGYTYVGNNREHKIGGGTAIYVHDAVSFKVRHDLQVDNNIFESTFIEIFAQEKNILVGCIYRAPNTNYYDFEEALEQLTLTIAYERKIAFVGGDLNINLLNFDEASQVNHFVDMMLSNKMIPTISKPTRVTDKSETLIDNIYTNSDKKVYSGVLLDNDISDHFPLINISDVQIHISHQQPQQTSKPYITHERTVKFCSYLAQHFERFDEIKDVDTACERLIDSIQSNIREFFPSKPSNRKTSQKQPWMTRALLTSVNKKNILFKTYLKDRNKQNSVQYKEYKNILTKLLRSAKKLYFQKQLDKHRYDGKQTWNILKEVIGTKSQSNPPQALVQNGVLTEDRNEICEILNEFFAEVGSKINASVDETNCDPLSFLSSNSSSIFLIPTDQKEVTGIIADLGQTSSGEDELSVSIIKALSQVLVDPLVHIINLSLTQGRFPNKLKSAIVIPVFKSGDKTQPQNYRPISIISNISKIFEKVIYRRIYNFLESHKIISPTQFGFRKHHSTEHALIHCVDFVTKALEDNKHSLGVYLDTRKAFDSVNHSILVKKLTKYGIRGKCAELIEDYLSGRTQKVKINDTVSKPKHVTCGIPQGSVLGPLLFIIYINDLNSLSENLHIVTFADDTSLFLSDEHYGNLESVMNKELQSVKTWFDSNKLKLNLDKTCFQIFTKQRDKELPELKIDEIDIKHSHTVRFLGLLLDNQLTFKAHIKKLSTKLSQIAGLIRRARRYLEKEHLLLLYNSLMLPHVNYCCLLWGINYKTNLQSIIKIQKRIARTILGLNYRDSVAHRFKEIGMLSLYSIVAYKSVIFAYKYLNHLQPKIFEDMLSVRTQKMTRCQDTFIVPFTRNMYRKHTSRFYIPETWNRLQHPCKLEKDIKLSTLKNNVKVYLLQNQYQIH